MTVYLDVLLILNLYVNYFLLKATAKITHTKLSTRRNLLASIAGSAFSLIILFPPLNAACSLFFKLLAAAVIVFIAFGFHKIKYILKLLFFFYAMNFIFAGVVFAVYMIFQPSYIGFNNAYFYIDFSLLTLVAATILAYAGVSLIRYFLDRKAFAHEKYSVIIQNHSESVTLTALADTGNTLVDAFSGQPVILCNADKLAPFLPEGSQEKLSDSAELEQFFSANKSLKGLRILPFSTVNSSGLIPVFTPDKVCIKAELSGEMKNVSAKIGIYEKKEEAWDAIFNPSLIV